MQFTGVPLPTWAKFTICITADLFDMTVGRLLIGVSPVGEAGSALINFLLWGPLGLISMWEVIDPTEQFDGFIPTSTLIALAAHRREQQLIGG